MHDYEVASNSNIRAGGPLMARPGSLAHRSRWHYPHFNKLCQELPV